MNTPAQIEQKKRFLDDVCVIRIILILLLIIYHSFCPYTSSFWPNPQNYSIPVYYWLGRLSYSFMLETFVFISGLILGYQVMIKGSSLISFNTLIKNKVKRLIIPSVIFSILYYILFLELNDSVIETTTTIINGAGHMWFLPMLFWCFVLVYIIYKLEFNDKFIIPLLFVIAGFAVIKLPIRINQSLYYILFFYLGFTVGLQRIRLNRFFTKKWIMLAGSSFVVLFPVLSFIRYGIGDVALAEQMGGGIPLNIRLLLAYAFKNFCQIIYSLNGVFLIYITVNYLIQTYKIKLGYRIVKLSAYCFGIYVFQEFIIRIFYYKCNAISVLNPYIFPWLCIIITLCISTILTHYFLKTKIGKFLLG